MNRDVLDRLAAARPANLDPGTDLLRRERDLAKALARPVQAGPGRRVFPRRTAIGLGLVATGAAAAVGVATLGGGTAPAPQNPPARQMLLAAASVLDKQKAPPTGRYWRQRAVNGQAYRTGDYVIYTEVDHDHWDPRSKGDRRLDRVVSKPTGPRTAADRAAWRKAGSPTRWQVRSDGEPLNLTRREKPRESQRPRYIRQPNPDLAGADDRPSLAERIDLGRDPAAFVAAVRRDAGFVDGSAAELMAGSRYVGDGLASPQARAAVFRMLADLPGIRSISTVKDALGRPGVGLAPGPIHRIDGSVVEYQLVLDPKTYAVLGDQLVVKKAGKNGLPPGTLYDFAYTVFEGWTSESPPAS